MKRIELHSIKEIKKAASHTRLEVQLLAERIPARFAFCPDPQSPVQLDHLSWTSATNSRSGEREQQLYLVGHWAGQGIQFHLVVSVRSTPRVATFAEANPIGR